MPSPNDNMIWSIVTMSFEENVMGHLIRVLKYCGMIHIPLDSPEQKVAQAYAQVWLQIMGNFTMTGFEDPCSVHVHLEHVAGYQLSVSPSIVIGFDIVENALLNKVPYFTPDHLNDLNFVCCGKSKYGALPFEEIANVYDPWTWFSILISTFIIASSLQVLHHRCSVFRFGSDLVVAWKVLLEQGDNFVEKKQIRLMIGWYLLMAVVLSNAYRNTIVLNMISHRKPIPYEYFEQLVRDNFKVYSRITSLVMTMPNTWATTDSLEPVEIGGGAFYKVDRHNFMVLVISEVATLMANVVRMLQSRDLKEKSAEAKMKLSRSRVATFGVLNRSEIHSSAQMQARSIHETASIYFQNYTLDGSNIRDFESKQLEQLMHLESDTLQKELEHCGNVAVILPKHQSLSYLEALKKKTTAANAFVGKESYSEVGWMLTVQGTLPPFLRKRIKSAHEAGVWDRWKHLSLIGGSVTSDSGNAVVVRVDGNVVIIFIILGCGLCLASFSLLLELGMINLD